MSGRGWTLGILAGGYSRRMGGRDKAALRFRGHTLVEHQARRLAPVGVPVLVGTRAGGPGDTGPHPRCYDDPPGGGPLVSCAALLEACRTPWLLVVPCDQPLLPPDLGGALCARALPGRSVLLAAGGRTEPFPALLPRTLAAGLRRLAGTGERRALAHADLVEPVVLPFETLYPALDAGDALLNVNHPVDWERARRLLTACGRVAPDQGRW